MSLLWDTLLSDTLAELSRSTLVGHSYGSTLVGGHSCETLLSDTWDALVGHSWDTLAGHSCGTDTLVGYSCDTVVGTLLQGTSIGHSCGAPAAAKQILRACAVEMHFEDFERRECTVNSSELAGHGCATPRLDTGPLHLL